MKTIPHQSVLIEADISTSHPFLEAMLSRQNSKAIGGLPRIGQRKRIVQFGRSDWKTAFYDRRFGGAPVAGEIAHQTRARSESERRLYNDEAGKRGTKDG